MGYSCWEWLTHTYTYIYQDDYCGIIWGKKYLCTYYDEMQLFCHACNLLRQLLVVGCWWLLGGLEGVCLTLCSNFHYKYFWNSYIWVLAMVICFWGIYVLTRSVVPVGWLLFCFPFWQHHDLQQCAILILLPHWELRLPWLDIPISNIIFTLS